ncbi:MAG: sugar phosphate isomerase/epimerase [Chloroflexia bacterium]|nr:sugar phosphate isomerase/epimerase [Chloroflexia bacterium]
MKIALTTIVCHEYTLPQIAEAVRRHGYDAVELYGVDGQKFSPDRLEQRLDDVRRDLAGVTIAAAHSWTFLAYRNDDEQRARAAVIEKALELASGLEVPLVKFFGETPPPDLSLDEAFDIMAETAAPLAKRAGELGVTLMVETHDGLPRGIDVHPLLSRVEDPALGVLWDVFHPHRRGEDVAETDALIGARTAHVHLKDNSRHPGQYQESFKGWKPVPLGEGEVPNREAVALLHARGYDGYLAGDAERMWRPIGVYDEPEVIMAQYAATMREYIASAAAVVS